MAYTPPAGDAVDLVFGDGGTYAPPDGDAVVLLFGESAAPTFNIAWTAAANTVIQPGAMTA